MRSFKSLVFSVFLILTISSASIASINIALSGHTSAVTGGYAEIIAHPFSEHFSFGAEHGVIVHRERHRAVWQAPSDPGIYTVTVTATKDGQTLTAEQKIVVQSPPAPVVEWSIVDSSFGGKRARVSIQNNSNKYINDIQIRMIEIDTSGSRVRHVLSRAYRGGRELMWIAPGETKSKTWSLFPSGDVHRVMPWVYEVVYDDGTVWRLGDN